MFVYVSNSDFVGGPDGKDPRDAVSVFDLDAETGALNHVQTFGDMRSPTYMGRNPKHPVLYVTERWINGDKSTPTPEQMNHDGVASLVIDPVSGTLSWGSRHTTGGQSPMHLSVNPEGNYLFAANPGRPKDPDPTEGHTTVLRLGADGLPCEVTHSVHYDCIPPLWRARPKTYPHAAFGDPEHKRIFVPHLMSDQVLIYDFNSDAGTLKTSRQPYVNVNSGAGPRHIAFHPSGRYFYVVNYYDATLAVFSYDKATGLASIVQTASVHPDGFKGVKDISHALVSATGNFLYCSHRIHNSIAVFAINPETGELKLSNRFEVGERPRDFALSPSGRMMVVTNQAANEIASFHVDSIKGGLKSTGHLVSTFSPNCVVFGLW